MKKLYTTLLLLLGLFIPAGISAGLPPTLSKLKAEGTLLSYHDFRSGSTINWEGTSSRDGTASDVVLHRRGMTFDGVSSKVALGTDYAGGQSNLTIIARFKARSWGAANIGGIVRDTDNSKLTVRVRATNTQLSCSRSGSTSAVGGTIDLNTDYAGSCVFTSANQCSVYVDGVLAASGAVAAASASTSINIGNTDIGTLPFDGDIRWVVMVADELTQSEIVAITAELDALTWPTRPSTKAKANLTPPSWADGLVAAWDMRPQGGTMLDVSGNGYDGTIYGGPYHTNTLLGDAMVFDNSTVKYIDPPNIALTGDWTLEFWAKDVTDNSMIFYGGSSHYVYFWDSAVRVRANGGTVIFWGYTFLNQPWNHYVITAESNQASLYINTVKMGISQVLAAGSAFTVVSLGALSTYKLGGVLGGTSIYSRALSTSEIKSLYLQGARALQYSTGWGILETTSNVTSGRITNSDIHVSSGEWAITTELINGTPHKALKCIFAGVAYIPTSYFRATPTESAYGTFKASIYHDGDSTTNLGLISGSVSVASGGYGISISSAEAVTLQEWGVGAVISGGTATADGWNDYIYTREVGDTHKLWIDGAYIGYGSDATVTSSSYIVFDADANDMLDLGGIDGSGGITKQLGVTMQALSLWWLLLVAYMVRRARRRRWFH